MYVSTCTFPVSKTQYFQWLTNAIYTCIYMCSYTCTCILHYTQEVNVLGFKGPRKMTVVIPAMSHDRQRIAVKPKKVSVEVPNRINIFVHGKNF